MKERKEVIKHSAAIHIESQITLLQRRAWNVLLANAYDDLPTQEKHQVKVQDLMQALDFDSKNEEYLKEALVALMGCVVQWNLLGKDGGPVWGAASLLAEAEIKNGICTYAYGPTFRERLHNPRMYARLSLRIQNRFHSKHAQALWEVCSDYLDESRKAGETPYISLDDYRVLMGLSPDQYPEFKTLNKRVIKDPVAEINQLTDFSVVPELKRFRRKVESVKFRIRRIRQTQELPVSPPKQVPLFPDYDDAPEVALLKQAGLDTAKAWEVWQQGFDFVTVSKRPHGIEWGKYIRDKVELFTRVKETLDNPAGWLLSAIRENYYNPNLQERVEQETAEKKAHAAAQRAREQKREQLENQKEELEAERRAAVHQICEQLIAESSDIVATATETALRENKGFDQFVYKHEQTPLDNYQTTPAMGGLIDQQIQADYPQHFEAIDTQYTPRLAELDQQLAALS